MSSRLKTKSKSDILTKYIKNENTLKTLTFNETVSLYTRTEQISEKESSSSSIVQTNGRLSENCSEYISFSNEQSENMERVECSDWTCVPIGDVPCSKPTCPTGTKTIAEWTADECPSYTCSIRPPNEKECTVSGRLLSTFDGTSFKYEICDHLLARDRLYDTWSVRSEYLEMYR